MWWDMSCISGELWGKLLPLLCGKTMRWPVPLTKLDAPKCHAGTKSTSEWLMIGKRREIRTPWYKFSTWYQLTCGTCVRRKRPAAQEQYAPLCRISFFRQQEDLVDCIRPLDWQSSANNSTSAIIFDSLDAMAILKWWRTFVKLVPETRQNEEVFFKQYVDVHKLKFGQSIIFGNVQCGPDQFYVEFFLNGFHEVWSWGEFVAIGTEATSAVVKAKWRCGELQELAQSFQKGKITISKAEEDLNTMRRDAKLARARESVQLMPYASAFDWVDRDWIRAARCT